MQIGCEDGRWVKMAQNGLSGGFCYRPLNLRAMLPECVVIL